MSDEAKMYTKEQQLARGERRHHRRVASAAGWQRIIDAKAGPCRVCLSVGPVEYHHIVPRAIGGSDTPANIVPLCSEDHRRVTERDRRACAILRMSFTDAEYAYATEKLGEARLDERYPVTWERTS